MTIRVHLADDHTMVREGVDAILSSREGIEVVGRSSTGGEDAFALVGENEPDVIVAEIDADLNTAKKVLCGLRSAPPAQGSSYLPCSTPLVTSKPSPSSASTPTSTRPPRWRSCLPPYKPSAESQRGTTWPSPCPVPCSSGSGKNLCAHSPRGRPRSWCSPPAASPTTG